MSTSSSTLPSLVASSQSTKEPEDSGRVPPSTDENDLVTFRISEDWPAYKRLQNNEGNFVSLTHEELRNCGSVIVENQFDYQEWHGGVFHGGFFKTQPDLMDVKMGFFKLLPTTCKPYEFTGHNMQVVLTIIHGRVTVRSTAFYDVNGVKYMFGFQLKSGDAFIVPANCAYTVENWESNEEALIVYTTMISADNSPEGQVPSPISTSVSSQTPS